MNVGVLFEAARVRGVDLIPLVDLEREVLEPHGVVAVLTIVGRSQPQPAAGRRLLQVHDLFGPSVRRESELSSPTERPQKGAVEREGSLDVGDREVDVVNALSRHDSSSRCVRPTL